MKSISGVIIALGLALFTGCGDKGSKQGRDSMAAIAKELGGSFSSGILDLSDTEVTDAGLEQLKGVTGLEALALGAKVTDAGLEHLKGLTELTFLQLFGTKVTDNGVDKLQAALPKCFINVL